MNIAQDKLQQIAGKTSDLVQVINEGVTWVNAYLKDEYRTETTYELKKYRRTLKKVRAVVAEKPTIALFGASQVGKSYMANNLLYNAENKLEVYNHLNGELIDFIKHINPEGNQNEATGAITRFTATQETDKDRLPIKVKLFNPKDIICILCDTYFYDFQDNTPTPRKDDIQTFLQNFDRLVGTTTQTFLSDDEVYEIGEYLEKYFRDKSFVPELASANYWHKVAENIHKIDPSKWVQVFEILWNKHSPISEVLANSIQILSSLNFSTEIWVDFEALLRTAKKAIIDVTTLNRFFDHGDTITAQLASKQKVSVTAGKLSFITCEVVLNIAQGSIDNRDFINEVDIIDFPGARTRPEILDLQPKNLLEMMLRGKVSYLFNHYSAYFKSNTLCVCMRTAQTNVTSVPRLVNQWIEDNLGDNPEERAKNMEKLSIAPMFVIFTWWNTQLLLKDNDTFDATDRIKKLFETRFKEEVQGGYDWHTQWIRKDNSTQPFTNFYLLRDFKESKEIFLQNRDEQRNNVFISEKMDFVNQEKANFYELYKKTFVDFHKSKNFFPNPELSFLEASTPNKDGSEYIIENLRPVANNSVSVPIYINKLNQALSQAQKSLHKHYHSDEADEQIRKANENGRKTRVNMDLVFGVNVFFFGSFIEHLTISEKEIVEFYHEILQNKIIVEEKDINKYILILTNNSDLHPKKSEEENLKILMKYTACASIEETKEYLENQGLDLKILLGGDIYNIKNNSMILAESAREYWFKQKLVVENFTFFIEQGLDKALIMRLLENMQLNFDRLHVTKRIIQEIREYVDGYKNDENIVDMVAHITAGYINEFVNSMGWSFYSEAEKNKLKETTQKNTAIDDLVFPNDRDVFQSLEKLTEDNPAKVSVEKLIDYMDNLSETLRIPIAPEAIENVPMLKNYKRWTNLMCISYVASCNIPNYDVVANKQLGGLLDKMKGFAFVLN